MEAATFDEVLALEETFYNDGYQQGKADGVKAGRIEGRTFGLEKGFEKFVESGRLYGKSLVWANRMPQLQESGGADVETTPTSLSQKLPPLPNNQRLVFHALAESESLSTENSEDAVSDFDDRFKRAQAKAKVIERLVGETKGDLDSSGKIINGNANIEDTSIRNAIQ
ncbi:putative ORAOV1 family protein [Lachnellula hyalina]|uniref:Putative ORAOV1 family protein n=1 Tax=Lachnellula hyalina TaxID=1316788 RepID=A0A8H8TVX5_9HELO|nr:putative ORAOV1 family protein [Lachnellula hyalina]TVY22357.1 putative ORAOV1 family protein [Lachnellula hyalina]